jgi:hypothetical protein
MPDPTTPSFGDRLADLLADPPYGLAKLDEAKFAELWTGEAEASFVVAPRVQVAGYLELQPTLLVADRRLGTLGLVHHLDQDFARRAETILDQATYLRHLLLMEAGVDARPPRRPYTVECVLALPSAEAEQELKQVFRHTARQTSFWHSVGVNILVCRDGETPSARSVHRAFPWLLASMREWLHIAKSVTPPRRLRRVSLSNYRLPGERTWTLDSAASVHLVHGQNGSGKSSISEALELAVTGTSTRLQARNVGDYAEIIRNRRATAAARIGLAFAAGDPWQSVVGARGVEQPLNPGVPVSSFRLDQDAMDDLARRGPAQRAEVFLSSFFPNEKGATGAMDAARTALDAVIATLPPELQEEVEALPHDKKAQLIESRVSWVAETRPPTAAEIDLIRPVSRESLEALRALSPEIEEYAAAVQFTDAAEFERLLKGFNEALERLRARAAALLDAIAISRQCLAEDNVRSWRPQTRAGTGQDWIVLLERWSESVALADLAERHLQLSQTLAKAAQLGWGANLDGEVAGLFAEPPDKVAASVESLRKVLEQANADRKTVYEQLMHLSEPQVVPDGQTATAPAPDLTARQVRALDVAGESLSPSASAESLGRTLEHAFDKQESAEFSGVTIGADGWAAQLDAKLTAVQAALTHLKDESDPVESVATVRRHSYAGPVQRREQLRAALKAGKEVETATLRVNEIFLKAMENERFNAALNELISLFTPARWAYENLELSRGTAAGKDTMDLEIAGATGSTADLLLNTAELNVFTLAMYLLAAVRIQNPLGLLLFDDPLQNMDELTVTTVARGLAKVMRVFPEAWQLAFLFHGEDDLERFRQEVPAAVYLLPWLAPAATSSDSVLIASEPLKNTLHSTLQDLTHIVVRRDSH